jgi:hypothetical protein
MEKVKDDIQSGSCDLSENFPRIRVDLFNARKSVSAGWPHVKQHDRLSKFQRMFDES